MYCTTPEQSCPALLYLCLSCILYSCTVQYPGTGIYSTVQYKRYCTVVKVWQFNDFNLFAGTRHTLRNVPKQCSGHPQAPSRSGDLPVRSWD